MTKHLEREQARNLRREKGLSVNDIAKELGVSKSSVSVWVRDIELTPEQIQAIKKRNQAYGAQHKGSKAVAAKYREIREEYQQEGRDKAKEGDPLHLTGCMLYWAEGTKKSNYLEFTNSDTDMMLTFVKFLRQALEVRDTEIAVYINCYTDNGFSVKQIQNHWLKLLRLPESCLRKTTINNQPKQSQQKGRKLNYGVCAITVAKSTRYVQHIYGAIQEYIGIDKPEWLS